MAADGIQLCDEDQARSYVMQCYSAGEARINKTGFKDGSFYWEFRVRGRLIKVFRNGTTEEVQNQH